MNAQSFTIQMIWPMLKFLKSRSNVMVRRSKIKVPVERSFHTYGDVTIAGGGSKIMYIVPLTRKEKNFIVPHLL
jgi:hypothetical protein